jgi:3-methyl-2-oxobutanoate hydroxymethyltransferase
LCLEIKEGENSIAKPTVKDLFELKGKRVLSNVNVQNVMEARACNEARIDIINSDRPVDGVKAIADAAPYCFYVNAIRYGQVSTIPEAIQTGIAYLQNGADAIYCSMSTDFVAAMTKEGIPCVGHVGLVPYKATWTGGFKAVGKTVEDAVAVYELAKQFEDAGAIGIEVEVVPENIATEISKRLKMLTFSMGGGSGCDSQYLFAEDILGNNIGHVPRHAKVYRNHAAEYERLYQDAIGAFKEYHHDVQTGAYPEAKHNLKTPDGVLEGFLDAIGKG